MARLEQPGGPHPRVRSSVLLVATLLFGLLGMHGLGPVLMSDHAPGHTTMTAAAALTGERASTPDACDHDQGDCGSHMTHADATCASASVAHAPAVVPVLQPDMAACAEAPDGRTSRAGSGPDGGRAPPSLSELQLLRI